MASLPHLTKEPNTPADWFDALAALARYLRSPEGCPWDRERTALEFAKFSAEEAEELQEALAEEDNHHAEEEFGDCLFTLMACMAAAEAEGRFTLHGALMRAHEKLVRRHDHVFRSDKAATPEEAMASWQEIKARERAAKQEQEQ
jgi:tetrapyrrole methylase family protein / MazG family protein